MYVYIVRQNESAASIANKFGGSESELILANSQIPRKVIYYAGQSYTIFKELFVGQNIIIPKNWINRGFGLGAEEKGSVAVNVSITTEGEACDFDGTDTDKVTPGSLVCATGLVCRNGTCEQPGAPQPDTILCVSDEDCDTDSYCDDNTKNCIVGERSEPKQNDQNGGDPKEITPSPVGNCTDDAVIKWAQSSLPGVNPDGNWGCKSQRALEKAGIDYVTLTGCSGNIPDPCVYASSKCVNNKCPAVAATGGDQKKDLTKINEPDEGEQSKSEFPWFWVITGLGLVAAGGTIYYYTRKSSKNKKELASSLGALEAGEPARRGINNEDREQWIDNDEGLYSWWKSTRLSKREFIKHNKTEIDAVIQSVTSGTKQAHYLKYEPIRKFGHLNEPAKRQGRQLYIEFYDKHGRHVLGSDGTIVILPSEGITTVRGVMNRLKEIKRLNHIPPWAESYMILDYSKASFYNLPTTLESGSVASI